jgi:hypothetical protein
LSPSAKKTRATLRVHLVRPEGNSELECGTIRTRALKVTKAAVDVTCHGCRKKMRLVGSTWHVRREEWRACEHCKPIHTGFGGRLAYLKHHRTGVVVGAGCEHCGRMGQLLHDTWVPIPEAR